MKKQVSFYRHFPAKTKKKRVFMMKEHNVNVKFPKEEIGFPF